MASISKRGAKWIVRWRDSEGGQHTRTCPTRRSADALRLEVEVTQARGSDWKPETEQARRVVDLEAVLTAFVEHRSLRLRATTLRRYAENLDLFVRYLRSRQPTGALMPSLLSKATLEGFYSWLLKPANSLHGHGREADTARKIVEVAQLAWRWADESERWPDDIPRPRKIEMTRTPPRVVVAPTWVEMAACVRACSGWQRSLATLLYYTGFRVGETMLLDWGDVDLDEATITLRAEITKNKAGRIVPISPYLVAELATWGVREGYVVPSGRRSGQRERQARARDMKRAWERSGARPAIYEREPHHSFRKGFKTNILALGASPDAVDFLQGHQLGVGSRGKYIDPWRAFPLRDVVGMIPAIEDRRVVPLRAVAGDHG